MNDRIRELVSHATVGVNNPFVNSDGKVIVDNIEEVVSLEKFAELIIEDCCKQLQLNVRDNQECIQDKSMNYQVGWADGMFDAEHIIKEHFGFW